MARELQPCGTFAAYRRHLRRKETPCALCAEAARAQKNLRADESRAVAAVVVALAVASEPPVELVDELEDLRENLRIVRATMSEGVPHNAVPALSKRRQELVSEIRRLENQSKPEVSALDQLAQRRAERLSGTAN